jgi:hypothetical protein
MRPPTIKVGTAALGGAPRSRHPFACSSLAQPTPATAVAAFPSMVSELKGSETVLTGLLADRSAVFSAVAQFEALGLELLELRQIRARPTSREIRR